MAYEINAESQKRLVTGISIATGMLVISSALAAISYRLALSMLLVISVVVITVGARRIFLYVRTKEWIGVEARVLEISEARRDVIMHYYAKEFFYPKIRYQYIFQEMEHISDCVSFQVENIWVPEFDPWGVKIDEKAKFWHDWQKGQRITVYVNPSNPSESVIIKKISKSNRSHQLALIIGGTLISLVTVYLLLVVI